MQKIPHQRLECPIHISSLRPRGPQDSQIGAQGAPIGAKKFRIKKCESRGEISPALGSLAKENLVVDRHFGRVE